jgi:hypothetical protein
MGPSKVAVYWDYLHMALTANLRSRTCRPLGRVRGGSRSGAERLRAAVEE